MSRTAEVVFYRHHPAPVDPPSPDAVLLEVCARLGQRQDRWQELWDPTSPDPEGDTPADRRWMKYNCEVWPGVEHGHGRGLPGRLLRLRATTPEGLAAKAAAIAAMEKTGAYTDCDRGDAHRLVMSLLLDAAGPLFRDVGEQA